MSAYLAQIERKKEEREDNLRKNFKAEAKRLVCLLKDKYNFKKVYLYGSLLTNKPICPWTDIDLAIEGLNEKDFLNTYGFLLENSNFPVDLKPYEKLKENFKVRVKEKGIVIYEK